MRKFSLTGVIILLISVLLQANPVFAIGESGELAGLWQLHSNVYTLPENTVNNYCVELSWDGSSYTLDSTLNLIALGTYEHTVSSPEFLNKTYSPNPNYPVGKYDIMDGNTLNEVCVTSPPTSYCYNDYISPSGGGYSFMSRNNVNVDRDMDGTPDVCVSPAPLVPCDSQGGDTDKDTICNDNDNCPNDYNPPQDNVCGAAGAIVSGTIYYSTTPYGNIDVELIPYTGLPGNVFDTPAYTAISDATPATEGYYAFSGVADGEYYLKKYEPPGDEWAGWSATTITVAGSDMTGWDRYLNKNILLSTPPMGGTVTTPNPQLCWAQTDPAEDTYSVQINETNGWALVESTSGITGSCYSVVPPLDDGISYTWQIHAIDSDAHPVGYSVQAFTFATQFTCDDTDSDGVCDFEDNCPDYSNKSQADNDGDFVGDVCDNCPFIANGPEDFENQINTDRDEMGNICDPCPNDDTNGCIQADQFDGLTAELQTPLPTVVVKPGEPIPVELCQQNPGAEDEYTIFDCFTATYQVYASIDPNNPLPTMHKDRATYIIGIPGSEKFPATPEEMGDVDIIPAGGELCITCDIEERVVFPIPTPGYAATFSGDVCSTNYLTDRNRVNGACIAGVDPDDGCFDMKIGTVCAPLAEIKVLNRDTVQIDIKPGTEPNNINLGSNGKVPVAVLSSTLFDATTINPLTVELGGATVAFKGKSDNPMTSVEDVNGDGLPDLIVHIETQGFSLTDGDVIAELEAEAQAPNEDIIFIRGEDSVRVVPAK